MKVYTKIIFIILSITFLSAASLYAESKTDFNKKFIVNLNNRLFNGTFIKSECYPECGKWYSLTRKTEFIFDSTNRVIFIQDFNFKYNKSNYYEFKIIVNKYKYRIWNYEIENEWSALQNYTLIGNVLTLTNFMDETYILSK